MSFRLVSSDRFCEAENLHLFSLKGGTFLDLMPVILL
jgi:hypothetical protein